LASFHPRKRTEWRVISASQSTQNRIFKSEPAARKYADELRAGGLAAVRVNAQETTAWLVRVRCKGARNFAKTFDRRADAEAWAREKEGEIATRRFVDHRSADRTTLGALLLRYERDCLSHLDEHHPDRSRARKLARHAMLVPAALSVPTFARRSRNWKPRISVARAGCLSCTLSAAFSRARPKALTSADSVMRMPLAPQISDKSVNFSVFFHAVIRSISLSSSLGLPSSLVVRMRSFVWSCPG
jgi:hypothetical protein